MTAAEQEIAKLARELEEARRRIVELEQQIQRYQLTIRQMNRSAR